MVGLCGGLEKRQTTLFVIFYADYRLSTTTYNTHLGPLGYEIRPSRATTPLPDDYGPCRPA